MEPYTVALTSCRRFDLLERTLGSLLPRLDGPIAEVIVIEDSGDRGVHDVVRRFSGGRLKFRVIVNEPPIGQIRSIDRLYANVRTEWIFHCEDDWEFFSDGFIESSFAVLKEADRHSMAGLRIRSEFPPGYMGPPLSTRSGVAYHLADPSVARMYAGLSFNPGLRRMRDYRIVGPYSEFQASASEFQVARCYLELDYRVAYLSEPAIRHIGVGRHVPDFNGSRTPLHRLRRSVRKRIDLLRWRLRPDTDPVFHSRRRLEQARRRGLISNLEGDGGGSDRQE